MGETFWFEDPTYLYKNFKMIPKSSMSLPERMNALSRLIILITLCFIVGTSIMSCIVFLVISLTIIIILYYYNKKDMTTIEPYVPSIKAYNFDDYAYHVKKSIERQKEADEYMKNKKPLSYSGSWYDPKNTELKVVDENQLYISANQALVGGVNPKTKIAPINVAPIFEWNYWKQNDFQIPQGINTRTAQDFWQSGYYVSEPQKDKNIVEGYAAKPLMRENFVNNEYYDKNQESYYNYKQQPKDVGMVDKAQYYDKTNLKYDVPTNYAPFQGQNTKEMTELNKQMFTSTIVPGVYYKTNIIEPISFNEGISFTQQIPPVGVDHERGDIMFTAIDNTVQELEHVKIKPNPYISAADVYDPRSFGYGSNDRQYIDELTGQPRFIYDDVDAIRQPNYMNRSKVDFIENSQTYGPQKPMNEIYDFEEMRNIAEKKYTDDTLNFRTGIMESAMRKRNAELWQQRLAPISRGSGSYSLGGMR